MESDDGETLYGVSSQTHDITVWDGKTGAVLRTVSIYQSWDERAGFALSHDGQTLYVLMKASVSAAVQASTEPLAAL